MLTEKEIKKIFEMLGLLNEKQRIAILSQGRAQTKIEDKTKYCVRADDVTTGQNQLVES
jgi:hypothetical protein